MTKVVESFYFVAIFCSVSININKCDTIGMDPFDVVLGMNDGRVLKATLNSPNEPTVELVKFENQAITSLAKHQDHLFIAGKNYAPVSKISIHRCTLDSNNLAIDRESCVARPFFEISLSNSWSRSMEVVDDGLFVGDTYGGLHYCSFKNALCQRSKLSVDNDQRSFKIQQITGIAYDSSSRSIYVSLRERGQLYR